MTGTWLDVDAPDTNWRSSSEDPIPLILGRATLAGGVYRFFACRPLDGHARTDAGFLRAGTKAYTKSGYTLPFNYWPGWKRGLLVTRLPGILLLWLLVSVAWWWIASFPISSFIPIGSILLLASFWSTEAVSYFRRRGFEKEYLASLRGAIVALLKTRDGIRLEVGREMVGATAPGPTGKVFLPPRHPMPDGDRDNLLEMIQGKLGSEAIDGRFNMEGSTPYLELYVPRQPPSILTWEEMVERADSERPYLGQSATGAIHWEPGDEMPHIGIAGKTGSGKTELMSFAVAQFMRGGAGVLVVDIKGFSHEWVADVPGVHYARSPQGIHDALIWLEGEMYRRINERVHRRQFDFERLVVILEERSSTQDALRAHWELVKEPGMRGRSPATRAIDAVLSQARAVNINVIMAGQETAEPKVGAKVNYGSWAISAKMEKNHWRNVGADRRPAVGTTTRGRWGWVVGGQVTMFQAVYPDLVEHTSRLRIWAMSGAERLDVNVAMQYVDSVSSPWSEGVTTDPDPTPAVASAPVLMSLREFADSIGKPVAWLRSRKDRDAGFPRPVMRRGAADVYALEALEAWYQPVDEVPVD